MSDTNITHVSEKAVTILIPLKFFLVYYPKLVHCRYYIW